MLTDYYKGLPEASAPKTDLVKRIAKACDVTYRVAYSWVLGDRTPNKIHWPILSSITGIPENELFTQKTTNK